MTNYEEMLHDNCILAFDEIKKIVLNVEYTDLQILEEILLVLQKYSLPPLEDYSD